MEWYHKVIYALAILFTLYSISGSIANMINCKSGVMGISFPHYVCIETKGKPQ